VWLDVGDATSSSGGSGSVSGGSANDDSAAVDLRGPDAALKLLAPSVEAKQRWISLIKTHAYRLLDFGEDCAASVCIFCPYWASHSLHC